MIAELGLALALAVQEPPRTVALIFADRTEITTLVEAEAEFAALDGLVGRTGEAAERHAALVQALGVAPSNHLIACATLDPNRHKPLCETIRGRRVPLQKLSRD